jgi:endonuclease/exonuclease/phosphatase family metal-dependent hydrolase
VPPTPSRRPWWGRLLRALAIAYGVLATLGLVVVLALSDGHAVSYVLGLFATWWLAPALVVVPVAAAFRSWRTLAAVLAPAVAAAAVLAPYALHRLDPSDTTPDLRVATFNTTNWRGSGGLTDLVRGADADIVLLQEIALSQQRGYVGEWPEYPYRSYTAITGGAGAAGKGDGDAVWSKYPIVSVEPVTGLPAGARPADVVTVDVDGRAIAVISVHLASPCLLCSPRKIAENPAGDTGDAARVRVAEARRFGDLAESLREAGTAVVLGGDLNSAEFNEPLRELRSHGLIDVHRAVGTQPGLTRGASPGFARVDVVLVAGLEPVADQERDPGGSTHSPVVADLAWPG